MAGLEDCDTIEREPKAARDNTGTAPCSIIVLSAELANVDIAGTLIGAATSWPGVGNTCLGKIGDPISVGVVKPFNPSSDKRRSICDFAIDNARFPTPRAGGR